MSGNGGNRCYMCGDGDLESIRPARVDGEVRPFCPTCYGTLENDGRLERDGSYRKVIA